MAGIEERMMVGDAGLTAGARRLGKSARVRELQGDEEVVDGAEPRLVCAVYFRVERPKAGDVAGRSEELVGVRATFRKHTHRLPTPDEFRAALAKPLPASQQRLGGPAIERGIPALHGMDAPAVAHGKAADADWCRERRSLRGGKNLVVERNRRGERLQPGPQVGGSAESGDPWERGHGCGLVPIL